MAINLKGLLLCEPRLETQLALLVIHALFWNQWIVLSSKRIFEPWIDSKPWKDRWVQINRRTFKNSFFVEFKSEAEVFTFACAFIGILIQHAVGGFLCIPSAMGYVGAVVWAMAGHGALCEAGWELQDLAVRAWQLSFGGEDGKAKNPVALVIIMCIHHAMGLCMIIPMNIYHFSNASYHEFVFLLQFAAAVAMSAGNYGSTLDIETASGLFQMKISCTVTLLVMTYSRVVRYAMVGYSLASSLYEDDSPMMFCTGCLVLGLMGIMNTLMFVDAIGKFAKFMAMHYTETKAEDLRDAAAAINGVFRRQSTTHIPFFMTKSQKEWAKVRGAVKVMGALHGSQKKLQQGAREQTPGLEEPSGPKKMQ